MATRGVIPDCGSRAARRVLRSLGATVVALAMLPVSVAIAGQSHPFPHEAAEAGRWSLLIAFGVLLLGLPLALFLLGALFRGISALNRQLRGRRSGDGGAEPQPSIPLFGLLRGIVIGADGRVSTSKTVATIWTYSVASALLSLVIAKWLGHGHAFGVQTNTGLQGEYALLIGGPIGAAILAKGIVSSQVANGASKPTADSAQVSQLVANDQGETDLGDLQYVLFNTVALIFFFGEFLASPQLGLPTIPDVLLGLTSVSAVGYVAKKTLSSAGLALTKVTPTTAKPGDEVKLYVSGLTDDQGNVPSEGETMVKVGPATIRPDSVTVTAEGPIVRIRAPQLQTGAYDVGLTYSGQAATRPKALKISATVASAPGGGGALTRPTVAASTLVPTTLPSSARPPGTPDPQMPFDHLVVVMMENHSLDNLLGALSRENPDVDGLRFDAAGNPLDSNPGVEGITPAVVPSFPFRTTAQGRHVTQSWAATHEQINGGAMDGFVRTARATQPMGYYTREVLPFAYSLASQFTLANRWFCSVPGPTYPNRRFLLAGTAFGGTTTGPDTLLDPPPDTGTIFDRLSQHHVNWCDYFSDIPMTAVIPSILLKYPDHHARIAKFFHDCQAGTLPAVSFVDPPLGVLSSLAADISSLPSIVKDGLGVLGIDFTALPQGATEEDPQSMYFGELWAYGVVQAVLDSPRWDRTLLIYLYDEHGGYYDHVPPPAAIPPDDHKPNLQPGDPPGGYDIYGPRVPAIVVSPYSRPGGVTNVDHDHTSVLATIEAKWNLAPLTHRDANAETVMDFLDLNQPALLEPPQIQRPSPNGPSGPA